MYKYIFTWQFNFQLKMNSWLIIALPGAVTFFIWMMRLRKKAVTADYFKNKIILITGASSGLGEALAKEVCKMTSIKLVIASRKIESLEKLRQNILASCIGVMPSEISCFKLDLNDPKSIDDFCLQLRFQYPNGVDILINNAGNIF